MVIRIGVVGVGSMGALHARVVSANPGASLSWVADSDAEIGRRVADRFATTWIPEPNLASVDAVVVAAPTQFHYDLAIGIIDCGIPLLLEKPLAATFQESKAIVKRAQERRCLLMCGL